MTILPAPADAVEESRRLIALLEQRRHELPFADHFLAVHTPTHRNLQRSEEVSTRALLAWRAALARRWNCEIAARKLHKQVYRQYVEHFGGAGAPEVQLLSHGTGTPISSPAEILRDLQRLRTAIELHRHHLPFAGEYLPALSSMCQALKQAIDEAERCEAARRNAVLDRRMVYEVYRRARSETYRALLDHYGERFEGTLTAFEA